MTAPQRIALSEAQIRDADITLAEARGGELRRHFLAPGSIVPSADRIARVSVRLLAPSPNCASGWATREKGEIVAVIESREVADAKSEYLAARPTSELKRRFSTARLKAVARRAASRERISARPRSPRRRRRSGSMARARNWRRSASTDRDRRAADQPVEGLRRQPLRSPMSGRIAERRVDLGGLVGREGQESELFVIVDLDEVWVDLAVAPAESAQVREGRGSRHASAARPSGAGEDCFRQPAARYARPATRAWSRRCRSRPCWRPGTFVTAEIPLGEEPAKVCCRNGAADDQGQAGRVRAPRRGFRGAQGPDRPRG